MSRTAPTASAGPSELLPPIGCVSACVAAGLNLASRKKKKCSHLVDSMHPACTGLKTKSGNFFFAAKVLKNFLKG
jgi:hypothetical protein